MKSINRLVLAGAVLATSIVHANADSTAWVSGDAFYDAIAPFMMKRMEPADLAVRIRGGKAEFRMSFGPDTGPFSFNVYPTHSRAAANDLIQMHAEAENLIGGPSRLCLHKFARAVDGDKEHYLLYLVDEEQSGFRCISLPTN